MSAKTNADHLLAAATKAGITDPRELGNFMGQMEVESGRYRSMDENLHYSAERLLEVFPDRNGMHDLTKANEIAAGGPEAVANAIYGGQWGKVNLGNTEPGDGWRFHGRGYVQLTGRANYERTGRELGLDLVNHPELAADRDTAARIAIHYWQSRVVPHHHQWDITGACHDINGGENGLRERRAAAESWEHKLARGYVPGAVDETSQHPRSGHAQPAHPQSASEHPGTDATRQLQQRLADLGYTDSRGRPLQADGDFGLRTRHVVEAFQHDRGLTVDGIVGPATLHALEKALKQPHSVDAATSLHDPVHAGHSMFRQSLAGIEQLNALHGVAPSPRDQRIAGALTVEAAAQGLTRIDRVLLSDDANHVFGAQDAAQGALGNPKLARIDTLAAIETPLEQSSTQWSKIAHPQTVQREEPSQQSATPQRTSEPEQAVEWKL